MPRRTPEGKVKDAVKKVLAKFGTRIYVEMPVPGGFGKSGLDFHGCAAGRYFAIETKADEDKEPTPRQQACIRNIRSAGGTVFVIQGVDDPDIAKLDAWLRSMVGDP